MPRPTHHRKPSSLRRERKQLIAKLSQFKDFIRGSYFERFSTCVRPACACHQGERHGPRGYVTAALDGRPRQYYVPQSQTDAVRDGIQQYQRFMEIVDRISSINLELMQAGELNEPDA